MKVAPKGNPASPIWYILDYPTQSDYNLGKVFSTGIGFTWTKILSEAGLPLDSYIVPFMDEEGIDPQIRFLEILVEMAKYKPTFIVPLGDLPLGNFVPNTLSRKKIKGKHKAQLDKYAGSLLTSPFIPWPHYVVPTQTPLFSVQNWWYRDIQVSIDLGHLKEDFEYWFAHKALQPLPQRSLLCEPSNNDLVDYLNKSLLVPYVSVDIETIRPRKDSDGFKSQFKGHCGFPYTISLAISPYDAVAFSIWDYPSDQLIGIWRLLDEILTKVPQIGQNYYTFDAHFLEALGFRNICLERCQDTLIRHHILWPELEHKLQFQTKQYTRQPYYKDEGRGWSPKYKKQLLHYNALDTTVTYEIFLAQEEEFKQRPHLR